MKLYISSLVLFVYTHTCFSQSVIGKVLDTEAKTPIESAVIQFVDLHSGVITDSMGVFKYTGVLPQNCKIKVSAIGYETLLKIYDSKNIDTLFIELHEAHLDLNEVTVTSTGVLQKHTITNVDSKTINELNNIQTTNLGEALSNIPGVYQTSTGNGISKPVIRGLSGMRVVTYLNGQRIENQQWGGDHGMGITENGIGSVEVIKGPSALLYGADALGGVLYFLDENYAKQNQIESNIESQFESNTMCTKNYTSLKISRNNLRANIFANYSNNADYRLPDGLYAKNSRYAERNLKAALGYNKNKWAINVRYNLMNNHIGLPGDTEDSVITTESYRLAMQERMQIAPMQVITNSYALVDNSFYFDKSELKVLFGNTINKLSEFEEEMTIPAMQVVLSNYTYNILWRKDFKNNTYLLLGSQGMFQQNKNSPEAEETLIPDSRIIDNGIYAVFKAEIKKWELESGIRFDNRLLKSFAIFNDNNPIDKIFNGFNYSVGASRKYKYFMYRGNVSTGYRPPHLNELLSNGEHHGAMRYETGDINLRSENATQLDVSAEYVSDHLSVIVNPFYNYMKNFIAILPYDSVVDGLPYFKYSRLQSALLYGADIGFHYHPHFAHRFHIESSFSTVFAEDEQGPPLSLIPQTRINSSLRYEFKSKKKVNLENISLQHIYFLKQERVAVYEAASPAYQLFNIGANIKFNFKSPLYLKAGVKNIFNETYIDHLSRLKNIGLVSPGINYYVSLKINLNKSIGNKSINE